MYDHRNTVWLDTMRLPSQGSTSRASQVQLANKIRLSRSPRPTAQVPQLRGGKDMGAATALIGSKGARAERETVDRCPIVMYPKL